MGSLVSWQCLDELFCLLLKTSDYLDYQIFFLHARIYPWGTCIFLKNLFLNDYHSGNIAQAKRDYYVLTQVPEFSILPCDPFLLGDLPVSLEFT